MTVIHGIEIDNIRYTTNEMKQAILNNDPIEDKLHVIIVVSNPSQFASRYILAKEFIRRMEDEPDVIVYVVEMVYPNQSYQLTCPRHLKLKTTAPLWNKENMINLGVKYLLPSTWKAFAWIDADIEFESTTWATDALKILNGSRDILQLFSHCVDMNPQEEAMHLFQSFGFQYTKKLPFGKGLNFFHPGYAWAMTRKAYERVGGLFDQAILGSGDHIMSMCLIGNALSSISIDNTEEYKDLIRAYGVRMSTLRLGYVPTVIRHHYHGSKSNRGYNERWKILVHHKYKPEFITYDKVGNIIPAVTCPPQLLQDIDAYFISRQEDS